MRVTGGTAGAGGGRPRAGPGVALRLMGGGRRMEGRGDVRGRAGRRPQAGPGRRACVPACRRGITESRTRCSTPPQRSTDAGRRAGERRERRGRAGRCPRASPGRRARVGVWRRGDTERGGFAEMRHGELPAGAAGRPRSRAGQGRRNPGRATAGAARTPRPRRSSAGSHRNRGGVVPEAAGSGRLGSRRSRSRGTWESRPGPTGNAAARGRPRGSVGRAPRGGPGGIRCGRRRRPPRRSRHAWSAGRRRRRGSPLRRRP